MIKRKPLPTESIKECLEYDPDTGHLFWKKSIRNNAIPKGSRAGFYQSNGYIMVGINKKQYRAHSIAWFLYYGEDPSPDLQFDHINGKRDDNRIENLRLVVPVENCANRTFEKKYLCGTYYKKSTQKWVCRNRIEGKSYNVCQFETREEAHEAHMRVFNSEDPLAEIQKIREGYKLKKDRMVGCTFRKGKKRPWTSQIVLDGAHKHISNFDTELEAHEAYMRVFNSEDPLAEIRKIREERKKKNST